MKWSRQSPNVETTGLPKVKRPITVSCRGCGLSTGFDSETAISNVRGPIPASSRSSRRKSSHRVAVSGSGYRADGAKRTKRRMARTGYGITRGVDRGERLYGPMTDVRGEAGEQPGEAAGDRSRSVHPIQEVVFGVCSIRPRSPRMYHGLGFPSTPVSSKSNRLQVRTFRSGSREGKSLAARPKFRGRRSSGIAANRGSKRVLLPDADIRTIAGTFVPRANRPVYPVSAEDFPLRLRADALGVKELRPLVFGIVRIGQGALHGGADAVAHAVQKERANRLPIARAVVRRKTIGGKGCA